MANHKSSEKRILVTAKKNAINTARRSAVKTATKKALVAIVPCSGFGAPMFVRWTYAASMENIKEGLDRLEDFCKKH